MKTYTLNHTDLDVSRIAYGCMGIGRAWGNIDAAEAQKHTAKVIDRALELGINFFDHADIYADGRSEELFGEALRGRPDLRESMVIQTKCGVRFAGTPHAGAPGRYDFSYGHIVASVEGSLRRLGIGQLDILLLHRPDPLMEPDEVARAFDDLRRSGKVRHFGVSNFSASQIALLQGSLDQPLVVNQVELSLPHHHLINEGVSFNQGRFDAMETTGLLDYCRIHGLRVQPWTPLARGRIFDPPTDATERELLLAEAIAAQAASYGAPAEAIALAWLLRHPAGLQPVIGTTDAARITRCCQADGVDMTREDWYALFNAARGKAVP